MTRPRTTKGKLIAGLAVLLLLAGVTVYALYDFGQPSIQLDGNIADTNGATNPDDWLTTGLFSTPPGGQSHANSSKFFPDGVDTNTVGTIFTGGGSKDQLDIPNWRCTAGSVPDKDDIVNAMVASYTPPSGPRAGHEILYFAIDRFAQNGDAQVGFWFLQNTVGCNPGTGLFSGTHAIGDILVLSDFTQGGAVPFITAYKWVGTGGNAPAAPQFDLLFTGTDCSTSPTTDNVCAIVNNSILTIPPPTAGWTYSPKQGGAGAAQTYPIGAFYEGGIDVTEFGLSECFNSFLAETRSSQSLDAVLKDLAGGSLASCSISVTKASDVTLTKIGHKVHYTITVTNTGGVTLYKDDICDSLVSTTAPGCDATHNNANITLNGTTTTPGAPFSAFQDNCGASLGPLASCTITYDREVLQGDADPLVNTVNLSYNSKANFTGTAVNSTDDNSVNLFQPSVTVDKTGPGSAHIGDQIQYHFVITNTSSSDTPSLTLVSVIDDKLGNLTANATAANCGTLTVGASCNFNVNYTVVFGDYPSKKNTVGVSYNPTGFTNDIHDDDDHTVTVLKNPLTIETKVHDSAHVDKTNKSVPLNSVMHDTAKLGGVIGGLTPPAIEFTFYTNGSCSSGTSVANTGADTGGDPTRDRSANSATLAAGSYSYKGSVPDDNNYTGATSDCEPFNVISISTTPNPASGSLGDTLNDTATLTGGIDPTGNITFKLWPPSNATCDPNDVAHPAVYTDVVPVSGNGTVGTASSGNNPGGFATNAAGTWRWTAVYSGDANDASVSSGCADEPVTIGKLPLSLVTHVHNTDVDHTTDIQGTTLVAPASVDDSATVGGITNSILPTNAVVFTFYKGSQCDTGGGPAGSIPVTSADGSGNFIAHPSDVESGLGGNTYSFQAEIAGDNNYDGKKSACEPFFVRASMPLLKHSTSATPAPTNGFTFGLFPGPAVVAPHAPAGYDPADSSPNPPDSDGVRGSFIDVKSPPQQTLPIDLSTSDFIASVCETEHPAGWAFSSWSVVFTPNSLGSTAVGPYSPNGESDNQVRCMDLVIKQGTTKVELDIFNSPVDAQIDVSPLTATNEVNHAHTITATVQQDDGIPAGAPGDAANGFGPAPDGTSVTFSLLNNTAGAAFVGGVNTCNTSGGTGTCSVQINTSTAGSVDIHATTTFGVLGVSLTKSTDGTGFNSVDAHKVYVDAQIDLSPLNATNNINSPHTITATVQQDDGLPSGAPGDGVTGFGPAPDGTLVTFNLLNNTAGAAFTTGPPFTCTTTGGSCTIQINTSTPGSVDIHATTTFSVGGVSLTRATGTGGLNSADANKLYVAGTIELRKVWVGAGGQTTLNIGTAPSGSQIDTQLTGASGAPPLTTGQNVVAPGTYYMSEVGGLTGFTSAPLSCFNDANNNGANDDGSPVSVGANDSAAVASNQHVICTYTNTQVVANGCTPGFWKNHLNVWPSPYTPATTFLSAFGVELPGHPGITLDGALNLGGGGFEKLGRHGAAALLTSVGSPGNGFPYNTSTVITLVVGAINSGNAEPNAETLAVANSVNDLACPGTPQ